ncbi:MAG: hypothetical protein GXX84_02945 [Acidobacteria bacterium]|nr:hypothetical protein [Acidobacteriota bacterium]
MPFCPNCENEYSPGASACAVCGVRLPESADDAGGTELVELARLFNVSQAEMINELLEKNGIRTVVRGEVDPIGIASKAEMTSLLVEKRDLARARELYDAYFAGESRRQD